MKRPIPFQAILIIVGLVVIPLLYWGKRLDSVSIASRNEDPESVRWTGDNPDQVPDAIRFPNSTFEAREGHSEFKIEPWMQPYLNFWVEIYTRFTSRQAVLHDSLYVDRVFEVISLDGLTRDQIDARVEESKMRWRAVLHSVATKDGATAQMTEIESRVYRMYLDIDEPDRYRAVADQGGRLRIQQGLKDGFARAIRESGKYLPMIEEVFMRNDLPIELTRLPFVESGFQIGAHSKVGAKGLWQFMRSTGKQYLRITPGIDERLDPVRSTEAAARLLAFNYRSLQSWPLAVVAYNHGRNGMMRAVQNVGTTELRRIVEKHKSPSFGFASRNFFLSLLAAIEVERNSERYFGPLERNPPMAYVEVGLAHYVRSGDLIRFLGLDENRMKELNPGFDDLVWSGKRRIPSGYRIKIPGEWGEEKGGPREAFWVGYNAIPDQYKKRSQTQ